MSAAARTTRRRSWLRAERGSAMVIALLAITVMMAIGLGTLAYVDGQSKASGDSRVQDASYNLAEAALESAVQYLGTYTPTSVAPYGHKATDGSGVGGSCGPSSITTDKCPDPATVTNTFTQSDYSAGQGSTWSTIVRDNSAGGSYPPACTSPSMAGSCFWRESVMNVAGVPLWDSNGDGAVWVRSQATVQGKTRILAALVKKQLTPLPWSRQVVWSYSVQMFTATNGTVIDTQGSAANPSQIVLQSYPYSRGITSPDLNKHQISPYTETDTYGVKGHNCVQESGTPVQIPTCISTNSGQDVIALRSRAQAAGTYYNGTCPTAGQLAGAVVFIDNTAAPCSYTTGTNTWNSSSSPGMIVFNGYDGSELILGGSNTYYGLVYDADENFSSDTFRIEITNSARVIGAVINDGYGGLYIDSTASPALQYDPNVFNAAATGNGAPKILQGTFREVPPHS